MASKFSLQYEHRAGGELIWWLDVPQNGKVGWSKELFGQGCQIFAGESPVLMIILVFHGGWLWWTSVIMF